jgi:hypothetical protein
MDHFIRWMRREAWIDLLELSLVVAIGAALAHLTWVALAPRAAGAPASQWEVDDVASRSVSAARVFGAGQPDAEPRSSSAGLASGLALIGVFAGREPGSGRAVFTRAGQRPISVARGESIADGVELSEVHPDHVILMRAGVPTRIDLPRGAARPAPQAATPQPAVRQPARAPGRP